MKKDESFGVIPLCKKGGQWKVFLVQLKYGNHWGFPKGHPEPGETPQETALRELKEETNLDLIQYLQPEPILEQYQFTLKEQLIDKRVGYYVCEVKGDVILQAHEIQSGLWLSFSDAIEKATHPEGKSILKVVEKILSKL